MTWRVLIPMAGAAVLSTSGCASLVGEPAAHGCIHLADADLMALFDLLPRGTPVWIAER